MASWLPTYICIHMLCYGECFFMLFMLSHVRTISRYAVLATLHIFIGANRFGPGRKYLGKG